MINISLKIIDNSPIKDVPLEDLKMQQRKKLHKKNNYFKEGLDGKCCIPELTSIGPLKQRVRAITLRRTYLSDRGLPFLFPPVITTCVIWQNHVPFWLQVAGGDKKGLLALCSNCSSSRYVSLCVLHCRCSHVPESQIRDIS